MIMLVLAFESDDATERFEFVYTRWKQLMLSKANAILHDYALAEDAVSEAFIRVYKNMHKLGDLESGRTAAFLVMIVKNVSLTMLSKRKEEEDLADYDRASDFNLEQSVVSEETKLEIMGYIDTLSDELKSPFLMKYAYGYSLKEIGKLLNITENNAAVRIHRARTKLAAMLGESYKL